ncbi:hypothetical protein CHS0354_027014 [Potamilus streckersoni]|uniref:Uncharacterized protein n=1 Tax=Potamilus streckersoni TaxID=2493646 RepID=A0AAE0W596_9BIVA|nr:hypothetical protein CHS0354_027014 [Potamilus streckersoni]
MKMREDVWRDNGMHLWVTVITMKKTLNQRNCAHHVVLFGRSPKTRDLFQFSDRIGHTRVLDGSRKASEYFQIFYSDEVFGKLVRLTNFNATSNVAERYRCVDRSHHGDHFGSFYRILYIMDTMKERLVLLL